MSQRVNHARLLLKTLQFTAPVLKFSNLHYVTMLHRISNLYYTRSKFDQQSSKSILRHGLRPDQSMNESLELS